MLQDWHISSRAGLFGPFTAHARHHHAADWAAFQLFEKQFDHLIVSAHGLLSHLLDDALDLALGILDNLLCCPLDDEVQLSVPLGDGLARGYIGALGRHCCACQLIQLGHEVAMSHLQHCTEARMIRADGLKLQKAICCLDA